MRTGLKVRTIELGTGKPKICVPVMANTRDEIIQAVTESIKHTPDLIEFRVDAYCDFWDRDVLYALLRQMREIMQETVLLFTFRTKNEGGEAAISPEAYKDLIEWACETGFVDLVDVEAYIADDMLNEIATFAHTKGVYVVASNHHFDKTPETSDMCTRLQYMDAQGADIVKLAVMPNDAEDVARLLLVTAQMQNAIDKPVITMSMGKLGAISRVSGAVFGSAVTFATVGKASAPGQLTIEEVRDIVQII